MVLPFLALGAMAIGGVVNAVGRSKSASQAKRSDEADRAAAAAAQADLYEKSVAASKVPLVQTSKQTGSIDMGRLVAESEAAGFNPLSVLRAGGLAGFFTHDQTDTTTGHNAHLAAVTPLYSQGQVSSISPSGEFMQGIGSTISNVAGSGLQHIQHTQSLQTSMATASMAYGGTRSAMTGVNWNGGVGSSSRMKVSRPLGAPSYQDWEEEIPTVTNPIGFDWWHSNPRWSDIETGAEAAWGDVGGALMFPLKFGADLGYTMAKNYENITGFNPREIGPAVVDWLTSGGSWAAMGAPADIPQITVRRDPDLWE